MSQEYRVTSGSPEVGQHGTTGRQRPEGEEIETPVAAREARLVLGAREQSLLLPLLRDVAQALAETRAGADYRALLDEVEAGAVAAGRLPTLENFLEMGLQTGRFRARFGALGEDALVRLFHQTPRGSLIATAADEVNRALVSLAGQVIERIELSARGPAGFTLTIETDRCHLTLYLDPNGARIHDVELAV